MNFSFMRLNRCSSALSLCSLVFAGIGFTILTSDAGYAQTQEKASASAAGYDVDQMYDYAFGPLSSTSETEIESDDSATVKTGPSNKEIWSEFLFGSQNRQTTKPQFILSQRSEIPAARISSGTESQSVSTIRKFFGLPVNNVAAKNAPMIQQREAVQFQRLPQNAATNAQTFQNNVVRERRQASREAALAVQTTKNAVNNQTATAQRNVSDSVREFNQSARQTASAAKTADISENVNETIERSREAIANARRQRLNELNQLLAAKRPDEYAERMSRNQSLDFDVAEANRPMIRQASAVEPKSTRQNVQRSKPTGARVNNASAEAPVRPQSLKQSSASRAAVAAPLKSDRQPNAGANNQPSRVVHANAAAPSKEAGGTPKKIRSVQGTVYKVAGPQLPARNAQNQNSEQTAKSSLQRLPSIESHRASTAKATFTEPRFDDETIEEEAEEVEQELDDAEEEEEIVEPQTNVIRSRARFIDPKDL